MLAMCKGARGSHTFRPPSLVCCGPGDGVCRLWCAAANSPFDRELSPPDLWAACLLEASRQSAGVAPASLCDLLCLTHPAIKRIVRRHGAPHLLKFDAGQLYFLFERA